MELAEAVAEGMQKLGGTPLLYWPAPTSAAMPTACKKRGIPVVGEIYPDLQYAADGSLVIQRHKHETDVAFACAQVERYVKTGKVQAMDGALVELDAVALCIHGDGPNCTEIGSAIQQRLQAIGCDIKPFMP
ncbi:MAG: LamB/YcsF family protein, partial [Gammaproteobacteria bacterium]|nr:LamB/YcsF family protein [Gammaproteobacteria bacterium]